MNDRNRAAELLANPGTGREGFALPAAMFVTIILAVLGTAALSSGENARLGGQGYMAQSSAFWAAEAGLETERAQWDQFIMDSLLTQTGDSIVSGWTQLENGCEFRTVIYRIDGNTGPDDLGDFTEETSGLYTIVSVGRTGDDFPSLSTTSLMVRGPNFISAAALVVGGTLEINGNPSITGTCADSHANGNLYSIVGSFSTEGEVSGSGDVSISGNGVQDEDGNPIVPMEDAPQVPIPQLDPTDYCSGADYIFAGGQVTNTATGVTKNLSGQGEWGWKYKNGKYENNNTPAALGVLCFDDDVDISGQFGTPASPINVSMFIEGSLQMTGNSNTLPAHPEGIAVLAGGDIDLSGNPSGGGSEVQGIFYARSQCEGSGTVTIRGKLVCRDEPTQFPAANLVSTNSLGGNVKIIYNCSVTTDLKDLQTLSERPWARLVR